jgi:hypothetical protein
MDVDGGTTRQRGPMTLSGLRRCGDNRAAVHTKSHVLPKIEARNEARRHYRGVATGWNAAWVAAVERSLGKESRLPLTRLPPNPFVTHNCETAHERLLSCHLVLLSPLRPSILIIALRCCIFPSPLPP